MFRLTARLDVKRLLVVLLIVFLLASAPCADAKKKRKKGRGKKKKKKKRRDEEQKVGPEKTEVLAPAAGSASRAPADVEEAPAPATGNTFLASGTVLGLGNEPVVLAAPKKNNKKKKKKKKKKSHEGGGGGGDGGDGGEEYLISVVATPAGGAGPAVEATVDPETGAFAIDGLVSGTEYSVQLADQAPISAGWGFTLSPPSIRVVDGSSTILSFVAIPSPAKAIATLSGVLGDADEGIAEKVTISLYRHGAENKVLQRTTLKESNRAARFFSFSGIPDGKYIVKASLQSKELDSKEVNIGTGQGGLVHLSASGNGGSSSQDSGGVGGDTDSMDDINAAGPFFSILFASLIFASVMFPSTAGTFLLPGLTLIAQLSGSARASMARSSVALLKKAADRAASRMEPAAGADDGYDMTGGLTTSKKKHKGKGK